MKRVRRVLSAGAQAATEALSVQSVEGDNIVGVGLTATDAAHLEAGCAGMPGDPGHTTNRSQANRLPAMFLALLAVATSASADLENPGFQTQDYTGWSWTHEGVIGGQNPPPPETREIEVGQYVLELLPGGQPGGVGHWTSTISQQTQIPLSPDDRWSFYVHLFTGLSGVTLAESQNYSPSFSARIEGQDPEGQDLTLEMWIRAGGVPEHAGPHYLISLPEGWSIQHLSGWDHWMFTSDTLTTHFSPGEEVTVSFTNWIGNLSPTDFVQAWAWGP